MLTDTIRNELKALYFQAAANDKVVNVTLLARSFAQRRGLTDDEIRDALGILIEAADTINLPVEFNNSDTTSDDLSLDHMAAE